MPTSVLRSGTKGDNLIGLLCESHDMLFIDATGMDNCKDRPTKFPVHGNTGR